MKAKVSICLVSAPLLLLLLAAATETSGTRFQEKYSWKELSFAWPTSEAKAAAIRDGNYISKNNLPLGFEIWRDRIFLSVPRWKTGVASSLNFIEISNEQSPLLHPFPTWKMNQLPVREAAAEPAAAATQNPNNIVSSFGIRVDECDRLWVVDVGITDLLGQPKKWHSPALLIFDLNTNELIRRYALPESQIKKDSFFVNVVVDVAAPSKCGQAFAYITDIYAYAIIVYDFENDKSWRVSHNYFHFDPVQGALKVGGVNFQWHDGIFGIALGRTSNEHGDRTLYFHALASTYEFSVANGVLKNESFSTSPASYHAYKVLGNRGPNTQSSAKILDTLTDVIFYTQINRDAVGCWNTKKPFTSANQGLVDSDSHRLVFPNDLRLDGNGNLLVLSNRMPIFIYSTLKDDINYRILIANASEIIQGTPCADSV